MEAASNTSDPLIASYGTCGERWRRPTTRDKFPFINIKLSSPPSISKVRLISQSAGSFIFTNQQEPFIRKKGKMLVLILCQFYKQWDYCGKTWLETLKHTERDMRIKVSGYGRVKLKSVLSVNQWNWGYGPDPMQFTILKELSLLQGYPFILAPPSDTLLKKTGLLWRVPCGRIFSSFFNCCSIPPTVRESRKTFYSFLFASCQERCFVGSFIPFVVWIWILAYFDLVSILMRVTHFVSLYLVNNS